MVPFSKASDSQTGHPSVQVTDACAGLVFIVPGGGAAGNSGGPSPPCVCSKFPPRDACPRAWSGGCTPGCRWAGASGLRCQQ